MSIEIIPDNYNKLNDQQRDAYNYFTEGNNIFITGQAGSGKSYLIDIIKETCKINDINFAITSTTGISALQIGGTTVHSFLKIGLAKESASKLAETTKKRYKSTIAKLETLQVLVIDEVSMMNSELFEKISEYLSIIKGIDIPFGGVQLILSGDFCQLPPVEGTYLFNSELWKLAVRKTVLLTANIRQQNDEILRNILIEIRNGGISDNSYSILKTRLEKNITRDSDEPGSEESELLKVKPTVLYPLLSGVEEYNKKELNKLLANSNISVTKYDVVYVRSKKLDAERMMKTYKIPEFVELCKGCQVMLNINKDIQAGLVNGSRGVIVDTRIGSVQVQFENGVKSWIEYHEIKDDESKTALQYMPLQIAYSISIHKSQGLTLETVKVDLGKNIFACGQAYTALSRVKTLNGLVLSALHRSAFKMDPDVVEFYKL